MRPTLSVVSSGRGARYTPLAVFRLSGDELVGTAPNPADPNAPQDNLRLSDQQG